MVKAHLVMLVHLVVQVYLVMLVHLVTQEHLVILMHLVAVLQGHQLVAGLLVGVVGP